MASIVIRQARPEDAPALGRVMVESWLDAHRDHIPQAAWERRVAEWTPEVSASGWARVLSQQAAEDPPRDLLLLAEEQGAPVALAYFRTADDGPEDLMDLMAIYVLPVRRGQGIGTDLLRAGARDMVRRGVRSLRVEVLAANLPARAFYASRGAREVGAGTFDEEGTALATAVFEWSDPALLLEG